MNKHLRLVNGYQETSNGSISIYRYGCYNINLDRLNTLYSRNELLNLTHVYKGLVNQDLIETILNLTKSIRHESINNLSLRAPSKYRKNS